MIKLFYDPDLDYAEIFFKKAKNYGQDVGALMIEFRGERSDSVVGFGFHRPFKSVIHANQLRPQDKIALYCFIKRMRLGLGEKELAKKLGISYRTYQRIEDGEIVKIEDFIKLNRFISEVDLTKVFKGG